MKSRMGVSNNVVILVLAGAVLFGLQAGIFSVGAGGGQNQCGFTTLAASSDNCGDSSTVTVQSRDQAGDSASDVANVQYAWRMERAADGTTERTYLGSKTGNGVDYTSVTIGDKVEAVAFNDTYDYATLGEKVVDSAAETLNVKSWKGVASSNVASTMRDDSGSSTSSLTLGTDDSDDLTIELDFNEANVAANFGATCFRYTDNDDTNITDINMPSKSEIDVPDRIKSYDQCYAAWDGHNSESPAYGEQSETDAVRFVVTGDTDDPSETVDIVHLDYAPYITTGNELAYGYEDDATSPADVGTGDKTDTLTIS